MTNRRLSYRFAFQIDCLNQTAGYINRDVHLGVKLQCMTEHEQVEHVGATSPCDVITGLVFAVLLSFPALKLMQQQQNLSIP